MRLSRLIEDLQAILEHNGDLEVVSSKNREYDQNRGFWMCCDSILWHTDGTIGIDIEDDWTEAEEKEHFDQVYKKIYSEMPTEDNDFEYHGYVPSMISGECFHGEIWSKCPHCGTAYEAHRLSFNGKKSKYNKDMYFCDNCGMAFVNR